MEKTAGNTLRYQAVPARTGRTVVGRLLPGTDLLEGIEAICREHGIKYGYVDCAIGCFKKVAFVHAVPSADTASGIAYTQPVTLAGVLEFFGGSGVICQTDSGEYNIHLHGSFCDEHAQVRGGHFLAGGNIVVTTLDFVISEIAGAKLLRRFDPETGFVQFSPEPGDGLLRP